MRILKTLAVGFALSSICFAQNSKEHKPNAAGTNSVMASGSAKVEHVFRFSDEDGYQFIAYQVTYYGQPIIVEDPIGSTNVQVGGELRFLVVRHDMSISPKGGKKIISFLVGKQ